MVLLLETAPSIFFSTDYQSFLEHTSNAHHRSITIAAHCHCRPFLALPFQLPSFHGQPRCHPNKAPKKFALFFQTSIHSSTTDYRGSPLNFEDKSIETTITTRGPFTSDKILNLEDEKGLFSKISTSRLLKSSVTLQMAALGPIMDVGMWVMNSGLMRTPILKEMILAAVQRSFLWFKDLE